MLERMIHPTIEVMMKILLRLWRSISVPAYKPHASEIVVIIRFTVPNVVGIPKTLLKYHGIAMMLIPCAKPEMELAAKRR